VPVEEISDHSESDGEEPYRRRHQKISPLSEELEEVQWPQHLNPAILPQFDGESDPEEFLLKYEATIEASGGGTACKAKALVLAFEGLGAALVCKHPFRNHSVLEAASLRTMCKFPRCEARQSHIL